MGLSGRRARHPAGRGARFLVGLIAAAWAAGAAAGQFDSTRLYIQGAWSVEHTYDAVEGGSWCAADTINAEGQWLSVVGYDTGAAAVLIGDPSWRMPRGVVRFRLDVDATQWEVEGSGEDGSVAVFVEDAAGAAGFLAGLAEGAVASVYAETGRRVAAFQLAGARPAIETLMECWARIEPAGPFRAPPHGATL